MVYKGQCSLKNTPQAVTVGTVLNLSCHSEKAILFKDNLFIQFPDPKDKYKLKILKILKKSEHDLNLEVTSYKTGSFSQSFFITDGESSLEASPISFNVQSVLPQKKQIKSHSALGPWSEPFPVWYLSLWGVTGFCILFFSVAVFVKFFKRKKFIKEMKEKQLAESPIKTFVKKVRRREKKSLRFVYELEQLFRSFMEELFFIKIGKKTTKKVIKEIKRYEPAVYKKYGQNITQLLREFEHFRNERANSFTSSHLKRSCYKLAFDLDKEIQV